VKSRLSLRDKTKIDAWIRELEADGGGPAAEDEMLRKLELPYSLLGAGKHRAVFDLEDGSILKVAKVAKGIACNAREEDLFRRSPSGLRKHLCPIVEAGHGWLVMKRVTDRVPKKKKFERQLRRILERFFFEEGLRISDIVGRNNGRPKRGNIRLHRGKRIVLIDYANVYPAEGEPPAVWSLLARSRKASDDEKPA